MRRTLDLILCCCNVYIYYISSDLNLYILKVKTSFFIVCMRLQIQSKVVVL